MRIAFAEDHAISPLIEPAPGTLSQLLSDVTEVQVFSPFDLGKEGVDTQRLLIVQMPLYLGDYEIQRSMDFFFHQHVTPGVDDIFYTSINASSAGVSFSTPPLPTTNVFSIPTAPSPGKTILGSKANVIPSSKG